jgi:hypothetical protein
MKQMALKLLTWFVTLSFFAFYYVLIAFVTSTYLVTKGEAGAGPVPFNWEKGWETTLVHLKLREREPKEGLCYAANWEAASCGNDI